jgi:hypothetical protein
VHAADDDVRHGAHGDLRADVGRVDAREPRADRDELLGVVDVGQQAGVAQRLAAGGEDRLVAREEVADERAGFATVSTTCAVWSRSRRPFAALLSASSSATCAKLSSTGNAASASAC